MHLQSLFLNKVHTTHLGNILPIWKSYLLKYLLKEKKSPWSAGLKLWNWTAWDPLEESFPGEWPSAFLGQAVGWRVGNHISQLWNAPLTVSILWPVPSSRLSVREAMLEKTPEGAEVQADSARPSVGIQQAPSLSKMNFPKKFFKIQTFSRLFEHLKLKFCGERLGTS